MRKNVSSMILVILAGETIFMLPFMIPRLFRPLMLEGWNLSNTDFGNAFAAYGLTAMVSYFIGGPFADKFHPRILISISLMLTALGSVYLMLAPSNVSLIVTYGFFGVSTVLLMWGALIKTTHIAGGEDQRSLAMGILDGGRGLTAAAFSSLLIFLVSRSAPELVNQTQQAQALRLIYIATIAFTLLIALGIWLSLKNFQISETSGDKWELSKTKRSLSDPKVWLLSIIILASYCGYKAIDNYGIYLVNVHKVDLSKASSFTSILFWLRPFSALAAGLIADKYDRKNNGGRFIVLVALLSLCALSQFLLAIGNEASFAYCFAVLIGSAAFAYGLRAVYFSVFGDLKIPTYLVGTTTGIVSFVGFMPDIFFGLVTGRLIDSHPGILGFQYAFIFTGVSLILGAAASLLLYFQVKMKSVV